MKKLLANGTFAALGLAVLVWSTPLRAQTPVYHYQIPFAFAAGEHVLPAGEYRVLVDTQHLLLRIESPADRSTQIVRLMAGGIDRAAAKVDSGMLRFQKHGARYFLSGVWQSGDVDGKGVTIAKRIVESAKAGTPVDIGAGSDIQ